MWYTIYRKLDRITKPLHILGTSILYITIKLNFSTACYIIKNLKPHLHCSSCQPYDKLLVYMLHSSFSNVYQLDIYCPLHKQTSVLSLLSAKRAISTNSVLRRVLFRLYNVLDVLREKDAIWLAVAVNQPLLFDRKVMAKCKNVSIKQHCTLGDYDYMHHQDIASSPGLVLDFILLM